MRIFLSAFIFLLCGFPVFGQVVINEYSASNLESLLDQFGRSEDWIELYNSSDEVISLGGYFISDKDDKPTKWEIPDGAIIEANGFFLLRCSGRDGVFGSEYHTNFKLSQTSGKDKIVFTSPDEVILESYDMLITSVEHSIARAEDGSEDWMVSTNASPESSNGTASEKFTRYTVQPTMSQSAGYYEDNVTVELINNEPNSILRYTTDGTNPTVNDPEYIDPIVVNTTTVIKALAFSNDSLILPGRMEFNTYFIDEDYSLAVFSVAADDVIELANGNGILIPIGSIEYFNLDKEREATSFGSLNRHGQDSWVLDHRSLDWVSRDEMGYSKAVDAPIFSYSDRDEYQKFMFRNSGDDNYPAINDGNHEGSTHIRDEYVQTLAQEGGMALDVRAVERVVLFLNGEYWGVYGMRERPVDHDYTSEYYDQGKYDIQYLSTWGSTEIEYGGQQALVDWMTLRDFILTEDMGIPENYEMVDDSINLVSLIDYMIVNLTVVASDWLNYNTGWWRGLDPDGDHKKWGYILWDLDATFDYYINYSGVPNISPDAEPCDLDNIADFMDGFFGNESPGDTIGGGVDPSSCETVLSGSSPYPATDSFFIQTILQDEFCCDNNWDEICQGIYDNIAAGNGGGGTPGNGDFLNGDVGRHETIFLKLLEENEEFKQLYYSRYADMMNTVYTCDNMIETLDRMLDVIRPEMPRQIARWGGTMSEWESNVERLKDFINQRCTLTDDGMVSCYEELSGPYTVTLKTEPDGIGEIDFNTLDIESFPWTGEYYSGMENKIKAKVFDEYQDEYEFSHWEYSTSSVVSPDENSRKAFISITGPDTLVAVFRLNTSVEELGQEYDFTIYPNPSQNYIMFDYQLAESSDVRLSLVNLMGKEVTVFTKASTKKSAGAHSEFLDVSDPNISSGLYFINIVIDDKQRSFKVNIIK